MCEYRKPFDAGCTGDTAPQPWGFWGPKPKKHKWEWSSMWNGNRKNVVPFIKDGYGLPRSGWRCYHCGKFVWDESDEQYALWTAYRLGYFGNEMNRKIRSILKGEEEI